jgi:hypothetical protein
MQYLELQRISESVSQRETQDDVISQKQQQQQRRATHTGVAVAGDCTPTPPQSQSPPRPHAMTDIDSNVDDASDTNSGVDAQDSGSRSPVVVTGGSNASSPVKTGRVSLVKRLSSFGLRSFDDDDDAASPNSSPMTIGSKQRIVANPSQILTDGKPASCAGYLMKCGLTSAINKTWKKRFFVLTGNLLRYYDDQKMAEPATEKRTVIIAPTTRIEVEESDKKKTAFLIVIRDRILEIEMLVGTNSEAVRDEWVRNLTALYRTNK